MYVVDSISECESEPEWPLMDVIDSNGSENQVMDIDVQHGNGHENQAQMDGTLINIFSKHTRFYKNLNASGLRLEVKLAQPTIADITEWLRLCMTELLLIIEEALDIEPQDKVCMVLNNTNMVKADFCISFRPFSQFSVDSILCAIDKLVQSNMYFFTDNNLIVKIDHVKIPVGYGRSSHIGKTTDKYYKIHKRSIFSPNLRHEDHGLCLAVSIVVGIAHEVTLVNINF